MKLTFLGAAGSVTGSCYLVETARARVLLECGQVQGTRQAEARNRDPLPVRLEDIDAVVLSHAHIDHSGRLPLLLRWLAESGPDAVCRRIPRSGETTSPAPPLQRCS